MTEADLLNVKQCLYQFMKSFGVLVLLLFVLRTEEIE